MRDIRPDLKERLSFIEKERARIEASVYDQLDDLDQQKLGVEALLEQEERRFASASGNGNGHSPAAEDGSTPLARFILSVFRKTNPRPVSLADFKAMAAKANFDFGEKAPGRVLHWALVGMAQSGVVQKGDDDMWRLKEVTQ